MTLNSETENHPGKALIDKSREAVSDAERLRQERIAAIQPAAQYRPGFSREALSEYLARAGFVYFATDGYAIKIGFSADPSGRMTQLTAKFRRPVILLTSIKGIFADEGRTHNRFSRLALGNEWFSPAPELMEYVKDLGWGGTTLSDVFSKTQSDQSACMSGGLHSAV